MHHRKTYMYINFQQNQVSRSVKTVHTNVFAKICKLHKFATCNYNFEKSRLSDMRYPSRTFRPILRSIGLLDYFHSRQTDRRTDGRRDGQTSRTITIGSFFRKKKKLLKTIQRESLAILTQYNLWIF